MISVAKDEGHVSGTTLQSRNAFEIDGDSMYPYVDDGSFVITSRLDSLNQIQDGKNYIIVTEEAILYKVIYQQENTFSLVSLNP